jgi:hypothetical protein
MAAAVGNQDLDLPIGGAPPIPAPNGKLVSVFEREGVRRARTLFRRDRRPMTALPKGNPLHGNQLLGEKVRFMHDRSDTPSVIVEPKEFQARWNLFTSYHLKQVINFFLVLCTTYGGANFTIELRVPAMLIGRMLVKDH